MVRISRVYVLAIFIQEQQRQIRDEKIIRMKFLQNVARILVKPHVEKILKPQKKSKHQTSNRTVRA